MQKRDLDFLEKRLFTNRQYSTLIANGEAHQFDHDAVPCVYLLGDKSQFLISEICYGDEGKAYGISYQNGKLTLGIIDLKLLYDYNENKEYLFNDRVYEASYPISVFKAVADEFGKIIPDDVIMADVFEKHSPGNAI